MQWEILYTSWKGTNIAVHAGRERKREGETTFIRSIETTKKHSAYDRANSGKNKEEEKKNVWMSRIGFSGSKERIERLEIALVMRLFRSKNAIYVLDLDSVDRHGLCFGRDRYGKSEIWLRYLQVTEIEEKKSI